jgi:small subunit ribosomal protein S2
MRRVPSAVIVTSLLSDHIAIKEARKMRIPVFGIADTNTDPSAVNFPIPANDDLTKSVALITTVLADAIAEAKGDVRLAANVSDENVKPMGIIEYARDDSREFLSRSKRSNLARAKSVKVEKKEEAVKTVERKEHNAEVKTVATEAKDFSKLTVVQLKELLKEKGVEFKSTLKKAELVELASKA